MPNSDYLHVKDERGLSALLSLVEGTVAQDAIHVLDLEADSLHSYREKICLMQLNFGGVLAIVDPLGGLDLAPLFSYLEGKSLWFHGGDYDLAMLKRSYQWLPTIYRDTQIAARLCGARQFGLAAVAEAWLGIVLSKTGQRADWGKRPLPPALLAYAVDDVRHLPSLVEKLMARLGELGRMPWFEQACASALQSAAKRTGRSQEESWRINGWGKLAHRELALLREIWQWRDQQASSRDRPAFKILNNEQMTRYIRDCHISGKVQAPPNGVRGAAAVSLKEAAEKALALDQSEWPPLKLKRTRQSGRVDEAVFTRMKTARDFVAEQQDLDPSLLASRTTLEEIALRPSVVDEVLLPWQRELLESALPKPKPESRQETSDLFESQDAGRVD
jgi:ribonuclease D